MTITLYGIANCDTVKKTKKLLDTHQVDYQFYDYKKQAPSHDMLQRWLDNFGAEKVINKRGTTWRKLDDNQKALAEKGSKHQIQLLLDNHSMIKRPIIEKSDSSDALIGFDQQAITSFIN